MHKVGLLSLLSLVFASGCAVSEGLGPEEAAAGGSAGMPGVAGAGASNGVGGIPGAGGGPGTGGAPSGSGGAPTGSGGAPSQNGCAPGLESIYMLTALEKPVLHRFDAATFGFSEVGPVLCAFSPPVLSFAIGRDGTAWLSATNGHLYRVDLDTLACDDTGYDPKPSGWYQMQLAFAAVGPGSINETLYAVDVPTGTLGQIDTSTLEVTKIGALSPSINLPRITGTGEGKLFAMGFTTPIGEVDKQNGKVKVMKDVQELSGTGGGLGFAQLEGDLFAFRGVGDKTVRVGRYSPAKNAFVTLKDVAITQQALVAGAGVSTCAKY